MKRLGFDLILLGDTASGKDTHALLLAKKYKVRLARSGEYLRKVWPKQYVQGGVAPSNLIVLFVNYIFKNIGKDKDIIFVGAARLKSEAQYLVEQLKRRKRDFFVIYLQLPEKEIIERSKLRGERPEDIDLKLINQRIKYYKDKVSKTVKFYTKLKKIKYINANHIIPQVSNDIQKAINDYQKSKRD